ncbi:PTS sugar transporter subunit IIC [Lacrimispora brassicae]
MLEQVTNFMIRLSQNRYLRAIRDGIVSTLPLIMVGSLFLIIAFPPLPASWGITIWAKQNAATILLPYRMTMFIMSIYAVIGLGHSLAKSYDLDPVSGSIIATIGYLLTIMPQVVGEIWAVERIVDGQTMRIIVEKGTDGAEMVQKGLGFVAPMANLGSAGLFVGMIVGIISVEILRFTTKNNITIKMPDSVPPSVARSFEAIVPTLLVTLLVSTIVYWLKIDVHGLISIVVKPLVSATDSIFSVWLLVILITLFWSFGIHGVSIIGALARPVWLILQEQNAAALAAGQTIPNVAPETFFQWFIWIGGAGATIGLATLLAFRSKSEFGKALGKTVFLPAVFNINEPIIFGTPIVLNPILIPPFVLAPLANATIAYIAVSTGMVNKLVALPPWTLPGPIGAFIATGGDYRGVILNVLLIFLSIIIYYPFFIRYDAKLLAEEQENNTDKD